MSDMRKQSFLGLMASVSLLALSSLAQAQDGFSISNGGKLIAGDPKLVELARRHAARAPADLHVTVDGLGVRPRLELEVAEASVGYVLLQSRVNYPAWIVRGEVRLLDQATGRLISTAALASNGTVRLDLPKGDLAAVYRVYDSAGRFDETAPIAMDHVHAATEEQGIDSAARRRIPVSGGAVTVSGTGLTPGSAVQTLGESIHADGSGAFVLQRILPPGDHSVPVQIAGRGVVTQPMITIPNAEWFNVGIVDLTYGKTIKGASKGDSFTKGRVAYYSSGKTASGYKITSSADTGETEIRDLFRDFDRKDPQGVLARLDLEMAYPVYGDDSTLENDAPTNGKFYLKVERDGSHLTWGNFKGELTGAQYLRNERSLYGLQGVYRSPVQTTEGEARFAATLYAAQPDNLPGRESFLGTGGSIYFLKRQDIGKASETLTIERRDPVSGRVIDQRKLVAGRDYQINYIQGVITLSQPLSGFGSSGTVDTGAGSTPEVRLVAQYEYTPTAGQVDGYAYGGRVEAWVTDQLRLGVTGMVEQTDVADQTGTGVDLHYSLGQNSFVELEAAKTKGPGFGSSSSEDGGLIVSTDPNANGTGQGYRFKTSVDLADLGMATKGNFTAYSEGRTAGFSTLDHQTTSDEDLWGVSAEVQASEKLGFHLAYDAFKSDAGRRDNTGTAELIYQQNDRLKYTLGLVRNDRVELNDAVKTGSRSDLALRADFNQSDSLSYGVFGQATLAHSGGRSRNDRLGAGVKLGFGKGWSAEAELSTGTDGAGGKALMRYEAVGNSTYFGYELDTGRELDGVTLNGSDAGRVIAGGKRKISDSTEVFGENTYDMFGRHKSLVSSYGVTYKTSQFMTLSGGFEFGQLQDPTGDLDRRAVTLGLQYQDESGLSAKARLELRLDRGGAGNASHDVDSVMLAGNIAYQVNDAKRWLLSFDMANNSGTASSVLNGQYAKVVLGYGYRPVENDRLNVLARYTYLYDLYGQRIDGTVDAGPRQKSHVFSIDATYDLNHNWQLGGKLGLRLSESAPDGTTPLARNDAGLLVLNARYHLNYQWDALLEGRYLTARPAGLDDFGVVATLYRQMGQHTMLGVGYNFGEISDDLTDLNTQKQNLFLNLVAKF